MNIALTNEEFRDLLDMLQIAQVVLHAHKTEDDPRADKYDAVMQKILAVSREAGLENLVEYNTVMKEYHPTTVFEETSEAGTFIDEFVDDTFWDILIRRLTDRDMARTVGGYEQMDDLSEAERFSLEIPLIKKYSNEFDEQGLERLEIVEHDALLTLPVKTSD